VAEFVRFTLDDGSEVMFRMFPAPGTGRLPPAFSLSRPRPTPTSALASSRTPALSRLACAVGREAQARRPDEDRACTRPPLRETDRLSG
jgi:hypothetical protein